MNRIRRWWVLNSAKKSIKKYKKSKFPTTSWPNSTQSLSGGSEPRNSNIWDSIPHAPHASFVLRVRVSVGGCTFIPELHFLETVFTPNYHQSKKAGSVTILAFSRVTDKTINTKVRFLTSTFMVTLQLTRVAERERHSMIRTQRESSYISRQLIPILLRIIIQWRLTITFTFVKSIFRSGTTQSSSSAITR